MSTTINLNLVEPILVTEQFIKMFKFWEDGLQDGMMFKDELFRHYQDFGQHEQNAAFELANSITNQYQIQVVITNHTNGYRIWGSLRSHG